MSEDDVRAVLTHPNTMIGTDGVPSVTGKPHPRLYGTFARILGPLRAATRSCSRSRTRIHRMTGLPAAKFHLADRGRVGEGAYADVVIFDPAARRRPHDVSRTARPSGRHRDT
jgi:N-acyl-D-aspartate/D-glutamate deacylase